jgi:hypothetical protein
MVRRFFRSVPYLIPPSFRLGEASFYTRSKSGANARQIAYKRVSSFPNTHFSIPLYQPRRTQRIRQWVAVQNRVGEEVGSDGRKQYPTAEMPRCPP